MRVFVLTWVLVGAGCAGGAVEQAQLADLQKRLDESQHRASAAEHKAEDLQDQVFLLTDKLESQKVASSHSVAPRLPVVLLKPEVEPSPVVENGEDEIAFEGAARSADPTHARPQLVLSGDVGAGTKTGSKTGSGAGAKTPTQTVASPTENLGVAPVPPIAKVTKGEPVGDPVKLYKAAYELLRGGHHDDAARAFRDLVRRFPEHDLADNAQYWLGECFYDRKAYVEAMPEFRLVVTRYPLGNKAPDAMLKLAFCLLALGDLQKGRDLLKQLPESYPHTEAARLAELRLVELRSTGGTQ